MVSPIADGIVPWPEEAVRAYTAAGWWRGQALGTELSAAARAWPEATAVVDGSTRLSYASLAARADALATRLTAGLGLARGDRIVVQLPNCWQFVVLTLACLRAGEKIVPPLANSKRPTRRLIAPENAPFSWPNNSDSISPLGRAAQLTLISGL